MNGTVSVLPSSIEREGLESKEKFIGVTENSSGEFLDALHHIGYIALQHHSLMFLLQTLLWWLFIAEASPAPAFFWSG